MKKRLLSFATAAAMLISIMILNVSAAAASAAPVLTGTLLNGTLTLNVTGLASSIVQVEFLATDKADPTNTAKDRFDTTQTITKGTATMVFTGLTGSDYIINATTADSKNQQVSLPSIEVKTVPPVPVGTSYVIYENKAWHTASNGAAVGTGNKSLKVEAMQVSLTNAPKGASITYQVYENKAWHSASNGAAVGSANKNLSVEAVKISLSGLPGYHVQYSIYENKAWHTAQDGVAVGTGNKNLKVEAIRVSIVKS